MRGLSIIGVALLIIGAGLVGFNVFSGLNLVDRHTEFAQSHLIRGISIVIASILGNLFILRAAPILAENRSLQTGAQVLIAPQGFQLSLASIFVSVIGMITGTIANPGSFPLLHGILAFLLLALLVLTSAFWSWQISKL